MQNRAARMYVNVCGRHEAESFHAEMQAVRPGALCPLFFCHIVISPCWRGGVLLIPQILTHLSFSFSPFLRLSPFHLLLFPLLFLSLPPSISVSFSGCVCGALWSAEGLWVPVLALPEDCVWAGSTGGRGGHPWSPVHTEVIQQHRTPRKIGRAHV